MADSTLASLTAATSATGGLFYGTQAGADRKFSLTGVGAAFAELTNPSAVTFTRINADNSVTALSQPDMVNAIASSAALGLPIIVSAKDIAVLTADSPADIATITLPVGFTRWGILNATGFPGIRVIAETASGTLAGGSAQCFTAAAGGGLAITGSGALPSAAGGAVALVGNAVASFPFSTSPTIYIRQNANSANAGTVSFYLLIIPLV